MDFDEYEYLEKTVENPEFPPEKAPASNGFSASAEDKGRRRGSSKRSSAAAEGERDSERRSKRSKSEERSGVRDHHDRQRERGSSRHRERGSPDRRERDRERHRGGRDYEEKEREKEHDRDREKERMKEKEREREREKEKENEKEKEKEREKEREREREKEKEIKMEKEREKERSRRSSSRSERHRDEEPDRHREKSREREFSGRDTRRHREKKEDAPEPEVDPERDQRTVFAYQLSLKADERDVYEFFSRAGKVRDVRLIMDRNSRRSKGVGYIEFFDVMSVPMAIALSGQPLLGQPVMVKPSEAEKNLVQSTASAGGAAGSQSGVARRLYVGNLHLNITEDQLRQVFESFGQVELVQLPLDPLTGHCKGYGFVQFTRIEDAKAALCLNGQLEIAGRTIKVSAVTDQTGTTQDVATNAGDLDDDEGGGLSLNARSRALLMQKLDRTGTAPSIAGALGAPTVSNPLLSVPIPSVLGAPSIVSSLLQPALPGALPVGGLQVPSANTQPVEIGVPSECLLLRNMFDPNLETEPDFDLDIKEDVQDECSKYGTVKHIFVDKNSSGHVYLRFDNVTSAMSAQKSLHGRWFAGKMITASFMFPQQYEAKFPGQS